MMRLGSWRTKAAVQRLLSVVPGGHHANYVLQRRVSRSLPLADAKLDEVLQLARHHVAALERHGTVPVSTARCFEFGAGWDLAMPLALRGLGVPSQLVVDIRRLVRPELVLDVAARLRARGFPLDEPVAGTVDDALSAWGIDYRAPCDARATGEPAGSIDYVTSTNTLEHIPPSDIRAILRECRRLLRRDGLASFQVDYKDHYSYFDASVGTHAFLQYDERSWRRYNPALHHQNRLRHRDYLSLYAEAGFEVLEDGTVPGTPADMQAIEALPPGSPFAGYSTAELAVRESRIVLRSPGDDR